MDFLSANQMPIAAAGLGALGMMAPQQAAMPGAQAKTGYAPRYTWNPQTRQYENAAPSPYTYYAAGGGEVPYPSGTASYPQSRIEGMAYSLPSANPVSANVVGALPKTDYDARITQQGDVFTAAAGAYVPKSKGASTDIYKETFDPESAKEDQDLMGLIAKLSRNPNKDYAQGGTIKMADGGLFGALTASPEFQQLLKGSIAPAPARYSYDPRDQRYTQMAQGGAIKMADGGFMGNALPGMFGIISQMPEFANLVDKSRVSYSYDPKDQHYARMAQGGVAGLKEGAFVLPADVVAHLGNGSSKAGHEVAAKRLGAHPVSGRGDGMSDSISTTIDGKQPARIADGEAIVPPEQVKKIGRGSTDAGAKRLYSMMDKVRQARTGTKKQGRQINPEKFMPA
jgi:hypothetical protein